ncbi:heptaprenyl diphosphate synthase component 1 [Alkalibacillus haloalkaliphilus]|uniref:Heptaprenyl diphosphate synthase n=1 Tax=Alkalibacillus haloalkaliphilus TaxID=94136 RepID=A0A511W234_9BACI|nr:heptaprenyl diphosphate synthase component 1 [Alkalibacillus haloalkaliphilus]GEN45160.1 hypothetical protein AHA02nite_09360 [Alkalibacillus haloalkaliphilus]
MQSHFENINDVKSEFLKRYKHPYIDEALYDQVFVEDYMWYIYKLVDQKDHIIADALVNMQVSLNVHDIVDQHFNESSSQEELKDNQLKVLLGDYHSSLFYKLLSNAELTNALYHFLPYIKKINEYKVDLLHKQFTPKEWVEQVINVYSHLFNGIAHYYEIESYEDQWLPEIQSKILSLHNYLPWFTQLINNQQNEIKQVIEQR